MDRCAAFACHSNLDRAQQWRPKDHGLFAQRPCLRGACGAHALSIFYATRAAFSVGPQLLPICNVASKYLAYGEVRNCTKRGLSMLRSPRRPAISSRVRSAHGQRAPLPTRKTRFAALALYERLSCCLKREGGPVLRLSAFHSAAVVRSSAVLSVALVLAACGGTQGTQAVPSGAYALGQGRSPSSTLRRLQASESVLYSFKGGGDGAHPLSTLRYMRGALYGTTHSGGASNSYGTVFSVTASGSEAVVHVFGVGSDGAYPFAGLTTSGYGTTNSGGMGDGCNGCGTVYRISSSGSETVLHSFGKSSVDGNFPLGGLISVNGTLYGTTDGGGIYQGTSGGGGAVYSITSSGSETLLHSFGSGTDGASPQGDLLEVNGTLYGTT